MSRKQQLTAGAIALLLVGIYSWIMIATSGTAASWAWLILVAVAAIVVIAGRSAVTRSKSLDG